LSDADPESFDRRCREALSELLDIDGDMDRLDFIQPANSLLLAPIEKLGGGASVGGSPILVVNIDGENLRKRLRAPLPAAAISAGTPLPCPTARVSNDQLTHTQSVSQIHPKYEYITAFMYY
jgi:hypothetical protein